MSNQAEEANNNHNTRNDHDGDVTTKNEETSDIKNDDDDDAFTKTEETTLCADDTPVENRIDTSDEMPVVKDDESADTNDDDDENRSNHDDDDDDNHQSDDSKEASQDEQPQELSSQQQQQPQSPVVNTVEVNENDPPTTDETQVAQEADGAADSPNGQPSSLESQKTDSAAVGENNTSEEKEVGPQNHHTAATPTMVLMPDEAALLTKDIQSHWQSIFGNANANANSKSDSPSTRDMLHQIIQTYASRMERYTLLEDDVANLQANIVSAAERESLLEQEVNTLRNLREENETKCNFLQNKLVEAQKSKASLENLKPLQAQIQQVTSDKHKLETSMEKLKKKCVERVKLAESALQEERQLNEDRKEKMREYVHTKSEELRSAADANSALQLEIRETNDTLRQVKHKLDILTEQYTISQQRNRELTRELQHMEKNKQQWMEMGETMEAELQKTTLETEEHKNKRLTAKNELMSVLKKLEAEQSITSQLRDAIKFTFTPKALSQQQLLQEGLNDLENELLRLSKRLGKPTPATIINGSKHSSIDDNDNSATNGATPRVSKRKSRLEVDISRLLATLENETQKVSKGIMAFSVCVEQMHRMLDDSGDRTCVDLLTHLLLNTNQHRPLVQNEDDSNADDNFEEGSFVQR